MGGVRILMVAVGGVESRGRTGLVRGFGAGTLYPQVWLRDSATLIPATRFLLPEGRTAAQARLDGGAPRPLEIRTVGDDTYARLETDWAPHRLELALR